ncbi:hypothetical protein BN1723_003142 [Verticillium longisporum]|uniref:Uncharacterized protein n=1 Tax=Verticillium longisporum TaxID=100787 RepID=A0A0G4LRM1_VERLO|nr:hypothetical protein BN1723_003142 [Verticillium longisporum]
MATSAPILCPRPDLRQENTGLGTIPAMIASTRSEPAPTLIAEAKDFVTNECLAGSTMYQSEPPSPLSPLTPLGQLVRPLRGQAHGHRQDHGTITMYRDPRTLYVLAAQTFFALEPDQMDLFTASAATRPGPVQPARSYKVGTRLVPNMRSPLALSNTKKSASD